MKSSAIVASLISLFVLFQLCYAIDENPFVVIIPTYNNEHEWVEKNLTSVLEQEYSNYRVIIIDDCSPNQTSAWCKEIVARYHQEQRVTLVRNEGRCGALANTYVAIHACADNEIWIVLDGDDWFPDKYSLATFNKYYHERNALASFGQYVAWPTGEVGHAEPFPQEVIRTNTLRQYRLPSKRAFLPITAPRTGYAWLFKAIKLEDLLAEDGFFYMAAADYAYMIPVLEMAGKRGIFIPDILYIYNVKNPIADARVHAKLQATTAWHILHSVPYDPVDEPIQFEQLSPQEQAVVLLFAYHSANVLKDALYAIVRFVRPFSRIVILYNDAREAEYQEVKKMFSHYVWIPFEQAMIHDNLLSQLSESASRYVLFAADDIVINQAVDISAEIRALKKTHTRVLFNGISHNSVAKFINSPLPAIDLYHERFAWRCACAEKNWLLPLLSLTLVSCEVAENLCNILEPSIELEAVESSWSSWLKRTNMLVLMNHEIVASRAHS